MWGYLLCFIFGGFVGFLIMACLVASKDERDREALIKQLKDEIYEDIYSSKNLENKG